jgi:hypothetical protein
MGRRHRPVSREELLGKLRAALGVAEQGAAGSSQGAWWAHLEATVAAFNQQHGVQWDPYDEVLAYVKLFPESKP